MYLKESVNELEAIVSKVEEETGIPFDAPEVMRIFAYTVRKCELNGKGDDYIPILFENELKDHIAREVINYLGEQNRRKRECATSAAVTLV